MSPLSNFLADKRQALERLRGEALAGLGGPDSLQARVSVEGLSGIRRIRIRDFQILSDSPRDFAGFDLGPGSPELQLGVIGSCLTHVLLIKAAEHGLALHALEVDVQAQFQPFAGEAGFEQVPRQPHGIRYEVRVDTDAPDAALHAWHAEAERACPILNIVSRPHALRGDLRHVPSSSGEPDATGTDLRAQLARKKQALQARLASLQQPGASEPLHLQATVSASGRSGVRRIRIRDFQIISDSPPAFAGHSLGPSSPEIQIGLLGSCLAHSFLIQAAAQDIPLDALAVTVQAEQDERGMHAELAHIPWYPQNLRYRLDVTSPVATATLRRLLDQVERTCPIVNLLLHPQTVSGQLTRVNSHGQAASASSDEPHRA